MARTKMTARKSKGRHNPFSRRKGPYLFDTPMTIVTSGQSVVLQHPVSTGVIVEHVRHGVDMYHQSNENDDWHDGFELLQLFSYLIGAINTVPGTIPGSTLEERHFISLYQDLHNHLHAILLMCEPSKQPLAIKFIPNRFGTDLNYIAYPLIPVNGRAPNQYDIFTSWLQAHCFLFDPDNFSQTLEDLKDICLQVDGDVFFCLGTVELNSQQIYKSALTFMIVLIRLRIPIEIRIRIWYAIMLSTKQFTML